MLEISQMSRESCVYVCLCNWEVINAPDVQRHHWKACLTVLCWSYYSQLLFFFFVQTAEELEGGAVVKCYSSIPAGLPVPLFHFVCLTASVLTHSKLLKIATHPGLMLV